MSEAAREKIAAAQRRGQGSEEGPPTLDMVNPGQQVQEKKAPAIRGITEA
jgi:hypothetical protein